MKNMFEVQQGQRSHDIHSRESTRRENLKGSTVSQTGGSVNKVSGNQRLTTKQVVPKLKFNDTQETNPYSDRRSDVLSTVKEEPRGKENLDRGGVPLGKTYKARPFTEKVRLQRPEKTRQGKGIPRKSKTYSEMLKELQMQTGQDRKTDVKTQDRLHGRNQTPQKSQTKVRSVRHPSTYTERLREMKQSTSQGYPTRLRPRIHRRMEIDTGTINLTSRRQAVERRGIAAEPTPRSSTPYTDRLAAYSNTGTHRGEEDVVSPIPTPVLKSKGPSHDPVTYTQRLKDMAATAPKAKHRDMYSINPGSTYTYKAPQLRTPSPRIRPYTRPSADLEEVSDLSDLSPWSVSDDVKKILYRDDDASTADAPSDWDEYNDYVSAVNIRELEDIASVGSVSALSIDWDEVDQLISTVK